MPKQKDKALNKKYVEVLEKFGLLPEFDFSKKEKAVVKALAKAGDMDILALGEACQFKPEKTRKVCDKLLKKGAIVEEGDLIRLSPLAMRYLHAKKKIRKSAKKFYRFMDTLTEKELDEFMKLVRSFKIQPETAPCLEGLELLKAAGIELPEEPKAEPAPEEPKVEPAEAPAPEAVPAAEKPKPAPRRRAAPRRKPAYKKAEPLEAKPVEEKKEGEGNE